MTMSKTLQLKLTSLPEKAMTAYWVPNIHNSLLAVAESCNAGCDVTFHKNGIIIEKSFEGGVIT